MFESAELGHKIDKETFRVEEPKLRAALLEAQERLRENGSFPVIILISGVDGSGKGETINVLYEWMDPRYLSTHAFYAPTAEERARPSMWRYWRALPPKGRTGIFAGSWYSQPIAERINNSMSRSDFDQRMDQLNRFEAMLVNEGALVLKFWIHLSKDAQRERLKTIETNPLTRWRVTKASWDRLKTYDKMQEVAGHLLRTTNTPWAPWIIVEGTDDRYRSLTVGKTILESLQKRLADKRDQNSPVAPPFSPRVDRLDVLSSLDMTQSLTKKVYETELATWQGRLAELMRHPEFKKRALILAFEGSDAAGKGGAIRRVMSAMDARQYQIIPIAAPTEEERAQPYLWRFWRHMPRLGRVVIFDRTWFGCVPTLKSTTSNTTSGTLAALSSSSGCRLATRSNSSASRSVPRLSTSGSRLPRKTGATARRQKPIIKLSATWLTAPVPERRRGRLSSRMTSTLPGSRSCGRSANAWKGS